MTDPRNSFLPPQNSPIPAVPPRESGKRRLIKVAGVLVATALVALFFRNRIYDVYIRPQCAENLRLIGQACSAYASEHGGRYPDKIDDLVSAGKLPRQTLICPATDATPGHSSYIYVGKGLTQSADGDTIVAFESPGNHHFAGINVLFGDGHVIWAESPYMEKIAKAAASNVRPIKWPDVSPWPNTQPATAP